jgi:hypothetical protein
MVKEVPEYPAAPPVTGPFAVPTAQAAALTSIRKPQQNETENDQPKNDQPENDQLNSVFQTASSDVQSNARRKPPASAKATGRRAAGRRRTG